MRRFQSLSSFEGELFGYDAGAFTGAKHSKPGLLESADVRQGRFRPDWFSRLSGIVFVAPPLRARISEIIPLVRIFIIRFSEQLGCTPSELPPEAAAVLERHCWPGNVRKLRNVIERAVVLAGEDGVIFPDHIELRNHGFNTCVSRMHTGGRRTIDATEERTRVLEALSTCGGNQTKAAQLLGMSRRTLINRIEVYGIARPKKC
jgi:transcriptional regulator with PAS, ATPase and Fis domain